MTDDAEHPHGRRWGLWMFLIAMLILLGLFGGHWVWTAGANKRLGKQIADYHAAGEPIEPDDFAATGIPDSDNAALDLRAAARSIDEKAAPMQAYQKLDP